jgi:putative FmdB family regulatory protein
MVTVSTVIVGTHRLSSSADGSRDRFAWHSPYESAKPSAILSEAMPIYEYRCKKGHTFEVLQRFSDDPVSTCEVCGVTVQRVFHPVAVHFKGSGFYNTDYGTRKRSREKEAANESGSGEGSKDSKDTKDAKSKDSSSSNGSSPKSDSGAKKPAASAAD